MLDVHENVVKVQVPFSLWTPWKHLRECGYWKTWETNLLWDQVDPSVSFHDLGKRTIFALAGIEHHDLSYLLSYIHVPITFKIHCNILLQMVLQPGVGLGLLFNMPSGLSVPCSISPFVYTRLSQVHGHVIQPYHSWSSSSSFCIQLSVQHLFLRLRCLAYFLYAQANVFFGI